MALVSLRNNPAPISSFWDNIYCAVAVQQASFTARKLRGQGQIPVAWTSIVMASSHRKRRKRNKIIAFAALATVSGVSFASAMNGGDFSPSSVASFLNRTFFAEQTEASDDSSRSTFNFGAGQEVCFEDDAIPPGLGTLDIVSFRNGQVANLPIMATWLNDIEDGVTFRSVLARLRGGENANGRGAAGGGSSSGEGMNDLTPEELAALTPASGGDGQPGVRPLSSPLFDLLPPTGAGDANGPGPGEGGPNGPAGGPLVAGGPTGPFLPFIVQPQDQQNNSPTGTGGRNIAAVPEPGALSLFGASLFLLGGTLLRRRRAVRA